jgi:plastocyanin
MRLFIALSLGVAALLIGCTTAAPQPSAAPTQAATRAVPADPPKELPTQPPTEARPPGAVTPTKFPTARPTAAAVPDATPAGAVITFQDFEIVPAETTIPIGKQVTFLIKGAPGSLHQPYNFDPPNVFESPAGLGDGAIYTHTFNEPGAVTLLCGYHPNMVATLIVTP